MISNPPWIYRKIQPYHRPSMSRIAMFKGREYGIDIYGPCPSMRILARDIHWWYTESSPQYKCRED